LKIFVSIQVKVRNGNTLDCHFDKSTSTMQVILNVPIVKVVIGNMLFHPDDVDKEMYKNYFGLFKHKRRSTNSCCMGDIKPVK
jgi:hypothetical protein